MLHSQRNFEETSNTGCSLGMSYNSLDAANVEHFFIVVQWPAVEEGTVYGLGFSRIPSRCPSSCMQYYQFQWTPTTCIKPRHQPWASKYWQRSSALRESNPASLYVCCMSACCASWLGIVMPALLPSWFTPVSRMIHSIWSPSRKA